MAVGTRAPRRIDELIGRLDRYERLLAEQKAEIADLKRGQAVLGADPSGDLHRPTSRRGLLKVAGAGLLGAAGTAILGGKEALAVQGSAVIAGQLNTEAAVTVIDASGTTGNVDGVQGKGAGAYSGVRGDGGSTSGYGVWAFGGLPGGGGARAQGQGAGSGIDAIGGGASGTAVAATAGTALAGSGASGGVGLTAIGGAGDGSTGGGGPGIKTTGANTAFAYPSAAGDGVVATGGNSSGVGTPHAWPGNGMTATGGDSAGGQGGFGVFSLGGNSVAPGVGGVGLDGHGGSPGGYGVFGAGGNGSGFGVFGYGGSPNGTGGIFQGNGTGVPLSLIAAATVGPPSGTHRQGDIWLDSQGVLWICTDGTNFHPLQAGGLSNAIFSAVSTAQYQLVNSDGVSWIDVDATTLKLTMTPSFNSQAILAANVDLWTSVAGFNQDVGIAVSGGVYPTAANQPEVWKESGGFAGTFSPNAASVVTLVPLLAGTTYTIKLQWKANKSGASTIWAGAGPIGGKFSPTRLIALLIVS